MPAEGRALMERRGGITLTIINPDQYRPDIVKLVAAEALKTAGAVGPDYGVEVAGLNEQLIWAQASATEVFLYPLSLHRPAQGATDPRRSRHFTGR